MLTYLTFLDRLSNRRSVIVLVLAYLTVFGTILLTLSNLITLTGGIGILDFEQGYSTARVNEVFASYGEAGFRLARRIAWLDLLNPALYGLLMALLARFLFGARPAWPTLLPMIAALLDYAENITLGMMMRRYPDISDALVLVSSTLSLAKNAALGLAIAALLVGLFLRLSRTRN